MRFGFCLQGLPAGALRRCAPARHRVHGVRDVDAGYQAPCGVDQRTLQATKSLIKKARHRVHGVRDVDAGYQVPCGVDQRTLQATQSLIKKLRLLHLVE